MNEQDKQKYKDAYDKVNDLKGRLESFEIFYNTWWNKKCLKYTGKELADYYDLFFSRFVTFNALYNSIVFVKVYLKLLEPNRNQKDEIIERGDREKAIECMADHPSEDELNAFFNLTDFGKTKNALIEMIEKHYVISHKDGKQNPNGDKAILAKLRNAEKGKVFYGLLEVLYNVRCNMFHGAKGYHENQIALLKLLNQYLHDVVILLYSSYKALIAAELMKLESEIATLKAKLGIM